MGTNNLPVRSLFERFHEKVIPDSNGCWIWQAAIKDTGYGVIGLGTRAQGTKKAHQVAWELYRGPIPAAANVLHTCDVRRCCNPAHLYLGTLKDNARDMVARGRLRIPNNRLENNTWHKLSVEQAREIKAAFSTKTRHTATNLANQYGVSRAAIYEIWNGKNWATA